VVDRNGWDFAGDSARMAEAGRRMAAKNLADNPDKLKELEGIFGKPYCQARYPEVYQRGGWRGLVRNILRTSQRP